MSYVLESNKEILKKVEDELNVWVEVYKRDHKGDFPPSNLLREKFDDLIGRTKLIDPFMDDWEEEEES